MVEGESVMNHGGNQEKNEDEVTFGFPIVDHSTNVHMKTILLRYYHNSKDW